MEDLKTFITICAASRRRRNGDYYEKVAQLVDLGIFDLEVGNVEKINADIIDKFYENESTEKRTGKRNIKKFSGAVTAEYFRSKIEEILSRYPKYKISDNNVYIKEYPMEFDFLILKSDAQKINGLPVYEADKVVAILESKKNGVYKAYNEEKRNEFKEFDLDPLAEAYFKLQGPAKNIRLGYMTMSENRPKKEDGKSDLIRGTWLYFQDKFLNQGILMDDFCFFFSARCHFPSKEKDIYMSDYQWEKFVLDLIPKRV